jgi:hypothetical protein
MTSKRKTNFIFASISFVLTFIFYFGHLIHEWTNVYLLRKGSVFFDSILSAYDEFQNTTLGFYAHLHIFAVGFTDGHSTFYKVWLYGNFIITFYILFRLLKWAFNRRR